MIPNASASDRFRAAVVTGLGRPVKSLPCRFFYDADGCRLFDAICELDEYYVTRTELDLLTRHGDQIARWVGPNARVIELGSGSGIKTRLLLDQLEAPAAYVPIDIAAVQLDATAAGLRQRYPTLAIHPVHADYSAPFRLPRPQPPARRTLVFFPGSTVGNLAPHEAVRFLRRIAALCGPDGALLIGVDLEKDRARLEAAYDDAAGVTAAFNLNLLARINRELGAAVPLDAFTHRALFDAGAGRVVMQLVSRHDQTVRIDGAAFRFRRGEPITTEYSYKYRVGRFRRLAARAGFEAVRVWTDDRRLFSLWYLAARTR